VRKKMGAAMLVVLVGGCASLPEDGAALGLRGRAVTSADRTALRLPTDVDGVLVQAVDPGSSAASAGIRPDMVVSDLNAEPVTSFTDLVERAYVEGAGRPLRLRVWEPSGARDVSIEGSAARQHQVVGVGLPVLDPPLWTPSTNAPLDLLADAGTGPDRRGLMLFRLFGYMEGGGSWDARFLVFQFGRRLAPNSPESQ